MLNGWHRTFIGRFPHGYEPLAARVSFLAVGSFGRIFKSGEELFGQMAICHAVGVMNRNIFRKGMVKKYLLKMTLFGGLADGCITADSM